MNTPDSPSPIDDARALLARLRTDFPVIGSFQPLSIGIDKQLIARQPEISRKVLRMALGMHTKSMRYLTALAKAQVRMNLEGNPDGEVTAEQRAFAADAVKDRLKKQAERRRTEQAAKDKQRKEEEAALKRTEMLNQLAQKFSGRR